ncbi:MAG: hypothetical protein OEW52_10800 [Thermoleophilia bacterium]|nr:hypothetical protein [Thermoleophilia bacterium]MDH4339617.1 hypothetical protein [Thermoleophilia bacterium]MDH5281620.1 hypothetical protein [Thermoleophilia bacterium]
MLERPSREQRSRTRRRSPFLRTLLVGVALVLAFLLGLAFSRTLDDRPEDGATVTSVRTLTPLPQEGLTSTVTVTVTAP